MRDGSLKGSPTVNIDKAPPGGAAPSHGIGFPRLYDLLLFLLTRGRDHAYRKEVLDLAGVATGHHVLDVGCGTGTQTIEAVRRTGPDGSVVGVDVSPKMLAAARRKVERHGLSITLQQADAAALPFDDSRFDIVTITTVLHMVPCRRHQLCLREAARVLKCGGRLLVIDYAGAPENRKNWVAKLGPHGRFDLYSLRDCLSEAGFERIDFGPLTWLDLHFLMGTKIRPWRSGP